MSASIDYTTLLGTLNPTDIVTVEGGQSLFAPIGAEGNTSHRVSTRSAMAALAVTVGAALLTETGRQGLFVWTTGNLSAQVTADPQQAIYVAPTSAPTGASGAWVRVVQGDYLATWWGVVAGTSSSLDAANTIAIQAALDWVKETNYLYSGTSTIRYGCLTLRFPAGVVRYDTTLGITGDIQIMGGGGPGSTVLHYTGTGRPAYINSLQTTLPDAPQNVRTFVSDGIIYHAPNATYGIYIGAAAQRQIDFKNGACWGFPNSEYALEFTMAVYAVHLHKFAFIFCDKGVFAGEYCDFFTMDGAVINFFNKREVLTLANPTGLIQNIDFEVGNYGAHVTTGDTCFVRIIQSETIVAKNRNITFRGVRFGPEAVGGRTVEYDVIFSNNGTVSSDELTSGVVFDDCRHFSNASGFVPASQKIAPILINSRIQSNVFTNAYYGNYSSEYYITTTDAAAVHSPGAVATSKVDKLGYVDPLIRGRFVSDEWQYVQCYSGNTSLAANNICAYQYSSFLGTAVIPVGNPRISMQGAATATTNYENVIGITYGGESTAERPTYIAKNGALITTSLDSTGYTIGAPIYMGVAGVLSLTAVGTPLIVGKLQTVGTNAKVLVDIQNENLQANTTGDWTTTRARNYTVVYNAAISTNRTVTCNSTNPRLGDKVRVTRTALATGAFTVTLAGKALSAGQFADAEYTASGWLLMASGSL
jgi:hypothetical protein